MKATEAVRLSLAPTGKLRAGMNLGNSLFTGKDAAGALRGVSVDVMRELASSLDVPVDFVVYPTPGDVTDSVDAGAWDVAILAIEPARAEKIAFSPPMTEIEATYVVHDDSPLRRAGEVDAAGVRVVAPSKAGYELFLTRTLRNATLIRTGSFNESLEVFLARGADALSGLKPSLIDAKEKLPGSRFVEGNFMTVNHGLGTQRARSAGAGYLVAFVERINAAGFVARSIERHGVQGLAAVRT